MTLFSTSANINFSYSGMAATKFNKTDSPFQKKGKTCVDVDKTNIHIHDG